MAKKKLPEWATTVTPFSKMLALAMLIILPIVGFYYGMYYQQQLDAQKQPPTGTIIIANPTPSLSPILTIAPTNCQSSSTCQPPNGRITCTTNADCPSGYFCAQPGPIIYNGKQHRSCWKKSSVMPL